MWDIGLIGLFGDGNLFQDLTAIRGTIHPIRTDKPPGVARNRVAGRGNQAALRQRLATVNGDKMPLFRRQTAGICCRLKRTISTRFWYNQDDTVVGENLWELLPPRSCARL